jgi:hypothetical protein
LGQICQKEETSFFRFYCAHCRGPQATTTLSLLRRQLIFSLAESYEVGCALVFGPESEIEIVAKISFCFEAKKGMLLLISHQSEKRKKSEEKWIPFRF